MTRSLVLAAVTLLLLCAQCSPSAPPTIDLEAAIRDLEVGAYVASAADLDEETRDNLELVGFIKELETRTWAGEVQVDVSEVDAETAVLSVRYLKRARLDLRVVASGGLDDLKEVRIVSVRGPEGSDAPGFSVTLDDASPSSEVFRDVIDVTGERELEILQDEAWVSFLSELRFPFSGGSLRVASDGGEDGRTWSLEARSKALRAEFGRAADRWVLTRLREQR